MKILFKCIFFTLLVLKITNAMASNYIYTLNPSVFYGAPNTISVCSVSSSTGYINPCKEMHPDYYGLKGFPMHIVISPDGAYAYIVTDYNNNNTTYLYACLINNYTGYFEYCTKFHKFTEEYSDINAITINATSDKIYILLKGHIVTGNTIYRIKMCSIKATTCIDLGNSNFRGAQPWSIAISANNKYAYLISNKVYICPIDENGKFNSKKCSDVSRSFAPRLLTKLYSITVNSNPSNSNAAYIITTESSGILYCPFEESGAKFGNCIASEIQNAGFDPASNLSQITLDYSGKYAYMINKDKSVITCKISGTNFEICMPGSPHFDTKPISIAYRRDRPDDSDSHQVTFHWKP